MWHLLLAVAIPVLLRDAAPADRRAEYAASRRRCSYGSGEGNVLILIQRGHNHGRRTQELASRLVEHGTSSSGSASDRETAFAFSVVPAIQAHLHNETIEALLDDDDSDIVVVEADCVVRPLSSQTSPPWGLDRIDSCAPTCNAEQSLDTRYTYGEANGAGAVVCTRQGSNPQVAHAHPSRPPLS